jgi:hypothetical protein
MKEEMSNPETASITSRQWIAASGFGWIAGVVLVIVASVLFDAAEIEGFQFYLGISIGGGVGLLQWRLLRRNNLNDPGWIWSSVFGMGFPFLLNDLLSRSGAFSFGSYYLPVSVFAGAVIVSAWQYKILFSLTSAAARWPVASFAGWIAAALMVLGVDVVKQFISHNMILFFINFVLIFAGGFVLGGISGSAMSACVAGMTLRDKRE